MEEKDFKNLFPMHFKWGIMVPGNGILWNFGAKFWFARLGNIFLSTPDRELRHLMAYFGRYDCLKIYNMRPFLFTMHFKWGITVPGNGILWNFGAKFWFARLGNIFLSTPDRELRHLKAYFGRYDYLKIYNWRPFWVKVWRHSRKWRPFWCHQNLVCNLNVKKKFT